MPATRPPRVDRTPAWWPASSAIGAAVAYTALAIAFTWPLATSLATSLPWDMGDPVLNAWIQAWSAEHARRFLTGDLHAFAGYWDAPIFYPAPLALAYSEHLFAQAVQVLPVWAITQNPVLCYNVSLLGTYVLSGLGAFLLTRDLTGDARAAFVAGLVFGFAPYRIAQLSHLQVLSAQWMPFVLLALRRHVETGSLISLAALVGSALLHDLSCGYYMIFFAPFAAVFAALEITVRRRWRDLRLLSRLALAGVLVAAGTWPFVGPYLQLRESGFPARPIEEVIRFSANAWSYLYAHPAQWLWGGVMEAWVKPEGELFPGVAALVLAGIGVAAALGRSWASASAEAPTRSRALTPWVASTGLVGGLSVAVVVLFAGPVAVRLAGASFRASSVQDALAAAGACALALIATSARARHAARAMLSSPVSWFAAFAALAFVLSLGPVASAGPETTIANAPYGWLYAHVPGYDGLRVPARYAMLVILGLSVLAGYGVHALASGPTRSAAVAGLALAIVLEGGAAPLPLDRSDPAEGLVLPPRPLPNAADPPAVYAFVRALEGDVVLAELPFGAPPWEVRYVYATLLHGRRVLNGYSGGVPQSYAANAGALADVLRDPEAAWSRLLASGATHVVVHEGAFADAARGPAVTAWLRARGARPLASFGADRVLAMPTGGLE